MGDFAMGFGYGQVIFFSVKGFMEAIARGTLLFIPINCGGLLVSSLVLRISPSWPSEAGSRTLMAT